jgi:hypothetical protein
MMSMLICETGADYQIRDHGSDIYTLIQKILNGSFFPDQHEISNIPNFQGASGELDGPDLVLFTGSGTRIVGRNR